MSSRNLLWSFAAVFIVLLTIVIPVSAASITQSPDTLHRGEQISITMSGLPDGVQFSLLIEGQFNVQPGSRFSFETRNFNMPISLNNGQISATTQNVQVVGFSVKKGGTAISLVPPVDDSGFATVSQPYTISSGTYEYLTLGGIARSDASTISTQMSLTGTKKGPADSVITFTIDGIDDGLVRLIVFVGNDQMLYKTVTVGSGLPPATTAPTTTATTVPTTTRTTTATATTSSTEVPYTSPATTQTTASGTTATATPTPARTFYSPDRKVSLTTYGIDYAGLLMVKLDVVPENWLAVTDAYAIAPETLSFSPEATISFTIPASAEAADYAYFIGQYADGKWLIVQSSAGTDTISGTIDRSATYALMAFKAESTLSPSSTPAGQGTTQSGTVTPKGTPKIASIAQENTPASAATKTPLSFVVVIAVLVVGGTVVMLKAKREH